MKRDDRHYAVYQDAIVDGLAKLNKYYSQFDEKSSLVLALGKLIPCTPNSTSHNDRYLVLHPYYKLTYIKLAWGGEEEQEEERLARNPNAKNWQDEAHQILEQAVRVPICSLENNTDPLHRWRNTGKHI
jgi:hypothetical protein